MNKKPPQNLFSGEFKKKADAILANYETKRASILEILRLVQEEYDHITLDAEKEVAAYLELPPVDVREVMTFYSLFYTRPRAETRLNICRTLACSLAGADDLMKHCEKKLGIQSGETTQDGKFSWQYVECLGACEIAPMLQLDDDQFVGNLTKEKIDDLIEKNKKA